MTGADDFSYDIAEMVPGRVTFRLSRMPKLGAYLLALGLAAGAVLCRLALERVAHGAAHFILVLPAVVLAGVFLGTGPAALTAAAAGIGMSALFHGPALLAWPPFDTAQIDALILFTACAAVLWATSALRRAAAEATAAEARLAEVFRQIPGAAAILLAPDGELILRSTQSDAVLGQHERRVEHSTDLGSYGGQHPDGRPFAADDYPIVRALKTGEIVRGEQIRYRRPCGHLADLDVHAGPVRAADGTILAAVGMAFDVTDRAEAQRRLHDSEARARAAAEHLQDALAAREVLMHEADHRIKNSLQLVVALLRLQIGRVADADAKAALNAAIARVNAIGDAHLALQRSPDLRTIEVGRMLDDLCLRLGALNPDVTVTCQAEDALALDAEQAIPLGLIASELVTNALRHAFPPGTSGTVSLTVTRGEGWLEMVVADGGVGLPAAPLRPGLGSTVVQTLARQIGGVVVTESGPGKGTVVKVKISASFL